LDDNTTEDLGGDTQKFIDNLTRRFEATEALLARTGLSSSTSTVAMGGSTLGKDS
jgi:hypothetical protein